MNDDLQFDGFDPLDDELRRRFDSGSATPDTDPDRVLDTMRPRLQQARTRRRASFASAFAGVAVVVVVLAFVLGSGGGDGAVRTPPATQGPVTTVAPTPTTAPTGGAVTPDTVASGTNGGGSFNDGTTATTTPAPDATAPTAPSDQLVPAAQDVEYASGGGSIVVHFAGGQVSLVSDTPAAGYGAEVHDNGPNRVEVRFSNGGTEWRIRVDVVNGQPVPEITQHG